jgi:GNAT superfamily N-acetyltransferase
VSVPVRAPRPDELSRLAEIGAAAGQRFRDVDMPAVADHPPFSVEELEAWRAAGRAWVSCSDDDVPIGFCVVDIVDGAAHIEEVSVVPERNGEGHGSALLASVADWARARGMDRVTLTTFRDVPWNAPFYERRGFRTLGEDELTPGLAARRADEAAHGLDPTKRVCMALALDRDGQ